jgi:parallel beta-helix repeat protein
MRLRRWYWLVTLLVTPLATGCGGAVASSISPGIESSTSPGPASSVSPGPACTGTALTPARNVQAAINTAPPGTTFCFGPGRYHVSSLVPKPGDVLDGGRQTAVLDGGNSAPYAVYGDSASPGPAQVTVQGFVIQNFKTPLQQGAIQDFNGPDWIIRNNHITHNAAAGVATGDNVRVLNNLIDHNGQEGFAAHGDGGLYQGNEIAYNNFNLTVDPTWEAGGGKAWETDHLTFRNNNVHDNGGPGLWADTNNINTTFDGNTVSNNWGPGIYEEISYNATIINNTVTGNGMPSSPGGGQRLGWGWDAGIQLRGSGGLSSSSPLVIANNTVTDNYNGITLLQSPQPNACPNTGNDEGTHGPCLVRNVIVEDNGITMTQGWTGGAQDGTSDFVFTSGNNRWLQNSYCVASATHPDDGYAYDWLAWDNWRSWYDWQGLGLDTDGTFRVGGTCSPPHSQYRSPAR